MIIWHYLNGISDIDEATVPQTGFDNAVGNMQAVTIRISYCFAGGSIFSLPHRNNMLFFFAFQISWRGEREIGSTSIKCYVLHKLHEHVFRRSRTKKDACYYWSYYQAASWSDCTVWIIFSVLKAHFITVYDCILRTYLPCNMTWIF